MAEQPDGPSTEEIVQLAQEAQQEGDTDPTVRRTQEQTQGYDSPVNPEPSPEAAALVDGTPQARTAETDAPELPSNSAATMLPDGAVLTDRSVRPMTVADDLEMVERYEEAEEQVSRRRVVP